MNSDKLQDPAEVCMTTHYGGAHMHCHPDQRQDYACQPLHKTSLVMGFDWAAL